MNIGDEVKRLHALHQSGALSDEAFAQARANLLTSLNMENTENSAECAAGEHAPSGAHASMFSDGRDSSEQRLCDEAEEERMRKNPFLKLRHVRRPLKGQFFGGVCKGLASFTGIPVWIWRLLFIVFSTIWGLGVVIYVFLWVFIPEEES